MGISSSSTHYKHGYIFFSLVSFFVLSSTHWRFMAEGRAVFKLLEVDDKMRSNEKLVVRAQIGSSPPRCDRKCSTCGESGVHCKAVQVPIGPQHKTLGTIHYFSKSALFTSSEYTYDYKPMTWKCKCGNMIYNP